VTLLRQGGWTRWPTEVPSNPYYSVILWLLLISSSSQSWGHSEQRKNIWFSALSSQVFSTTCTSFLPGGICTGPSPVISSTFQSHLWDVQNYTADASNPRRISLVIRSIWMPATFPFFNFWQSLAKLLVGKPVKSDLEKPPIKVI